MESHLRTSSVGISSLTVKDVTTHGVEAAIEQFRRTGLEAMLEKYGGGPSTKWYLEVGRSRYDQKLVVRAAHVLQRLRDLPPLARLPQLTHDFDDFSSFDSRNALISLSPIFVIPL